MSDLNRLIGELPEIYQPIFGNPAYDLECSRSCEDRLREITKIHEALVARLERPLRILDLGCAQGYFSMSLGALGASVHGVDYLEQNIAVCSAIAKSYPEIDVTFESGRIENILENLAGQNFDIVLGLSVFHHLIHEHGEGRVVAMFDEILDCAGLFVCEFALATEPLYWGASQPQKPRTLLDKAAFVHEIARFGTHLADIKRPLYVASNKYWCVGELLGSIESSTTESHPLAGGAHRGARRYIFSPDHVVKIFEHDAEYGERGTLEILHEAKFLQTPPPGFTAPSLYEVGVNEGEAWLVMERLPGQLLVEKILHEQSYDAVSVVHQILQQLAVLERSGYYHDDLRAWNVLLSEKGVAQLIDLGSISRTPLDIVWPHNIFLAAFIFIKEVVAARVDRPGFLREVAISPYSLPQPIDAWLAPMWAILPSQWSFALMQELFEKGMKGGSVVTTDDPFALWMTGIESGMQTLKQHLNHVEYKVDGLPHTPPSVAIDSGELAEFQERAFTAESRAMELAAQANHNESELHEWIHKAGYLDQELRQTRVELQASLENAHLWFVRASESAAKLEVIQNSKAWKATTSFRWIHEQLSILPNRLSRLRAKCVAPLLARSIRIVIGRPSLVHFSKTVLRRYPVAYQHLRLFAYRRGLIHGHVVHSDGFRSHGTNPLAAPTEYTPEHGPLSPKAEKIYQELVRQMQTKERQ
ncbi:methyltransferase domain-containing protein [Pseudomonas coleopterorum]|uniref:methyltransferase domain-containing protein n=1 Tax=Pseudomonas coleopterorum TaxID=1605838 RepID=UPI001782F5D9|nr:methyltransferase domain-containing protein [Pseudomonas coleopterorum]MBD8481805.1 methyltransferase domain-containing protein [Pseudomonas coleopterorum]